MKSIENQAEHRRSFNSMEIYENHNPSCQPPWIQASRLDASNHRHPADLHQLTFDGGRRQPVNHYIMISASSYSILWICYYPPAPCGPTGWEAYCFKQIILRPFNALQVCKFTALQCIAILQVYKCILLNPQNWYLTALQLVFYSQNVIRLVGYCQAGTTFYPPLWWHSQILGSTEIMQNLWTFRCLSSTLKNQ